MSRSSSPPNFLNFLFAVVVMGVAVLAALMLVVFLLILELPDTAGRLDFVMLCLMVGAQFWAAVQYIGYFTNVITCLWHEWHPSARDAAPVLAEDQPRPPVAIVVCSYKEPLDVLEKTLICFYNITYPEKRLYFLDDSRYDQANWDEAERTKYRTDIEQLCRKYSVNLFRRKWRGAKAGIINDFVAFLKGDKKPYFSLTTADARAAHEIPTYLIVFDADQNPLPDFVDDLVAELEADKRLAFVQTPQYYSNFEDNLVACLSGLQQAVFYEYICEGKSHHNSMFCCGTNVMFRLEALCEVGGFDETSITEDFATSLKIHRNGWHSKYLNKILAFGDGPPDLGAYFSQQNRWALGSTSLLRRVLPEFFHIPWRFPAFVLWEYFLSSSHYFVGWINFANALLLVTFLLTDVPRLMGFPPFIFLLTLPYLLLTTCGFFWSMNRRGYGVAQSWYATVLTLASSPVYMKATLYAILGKRSRFVVTPKAGHQVLPIYAMWPQLLWAGMCFIAGVWGAHRAYYEVDHRAGLLMACFWAFYFTGAYCSILFINLGYERESAKAV